MSSVSEQKLKVEWSPAGAPSGYHHSCPDARSSSYSPLRASKPSFMPKMSSLDLIVNVCLCVSVYIDWCLNVFFQDRFIMSKKGTLNSQDSSMITSSFTCSPSVGRPISATRLSSFSFLVRVSSSPSSERDRQSKKRYRKCDGKEQNKMVSLS